MSATDPHQQGTRRLAGHTAWNLAGMTLPMAVALFAIPALIRGLGADRFGALALVWMLVGYFSVFDLGLGRAMTRWTAERLAQRRDAELPAIFWTSLTIITVAGLAAGCVMAGLSDWLAFSRFNLPAALRPECRRAFLWVAAALPFAVATSGLIGILEAHRRFRLIALIRIPTGMYTFLGPWLVLPWSRQLDHVVLALIAGRLVEWAIYFAACLRAQPAYRRPAWDRALVRPMLAFGGWMTLSNLALPLLIHVDRFVIGAVLTMGAVTWYVTPAEIVVKLLILPRAWVAALFPALTAGFTAGRDALPGLYDRGVRYLLPPLFAAALGVIALAPEGLALWLGPDLAAHSARVMQWLAGGILLCSLGYVPYSLLQSAGRPDLSAKLHTFELPLYILLAAALARRWGVNGVAAGWCVRAGVEAVVMFALADRFVPAARGTLRRAAALTAAGLAGAWGVALLPAWSARWGAAAVVLAGWLLAAWRLLVTPTERARLKAWRLLIRRA